MNDAPSRDEIAARLEAAEARTEARFAQLTGSLEVRFASLDHKINGLTGSVLALAATVKEVRQEVRSENSLTRKTVIAVSVGGILAGLAAFWATQANLLSAFQAGLALQQVHASAPPK